MPQQNIQGSGLGSLFAAALGSPAQDMRNQADAYRIRQQMDLAKQTADLKQREYEQSVLNDNRDYQLKQALNAATVSKTGVETTGLQQKNALLESQMSAANDLGPAYGNYFKDAYIQAHTPEATNYGPQQPMETRRETIPDSTRALFDAQGRTAALSMPGADPNKIAEAQRMLLGNNDMLFGTDPTRIRIGASAALGKLPDNKTVLTEADRAAVAQSDPTGGAGEYFGTPVAFKQPDGTVAYGQISKGGNFKPINLGEGNQFLTKTREIDTGTDIVTVDQYDNEISRRKKENYQENFDKSRGTVDGKAIAEAPGNLAKAASSAQQSAVAANLVDEDINRAISMIDNSLIPLTGVGDYLSDVKGSPQSNLKSILHTIKSNVGFDRLQQMREASPTGGALGAVSDNENVLLQSAMGALEQSQTDDQLKFNLQRLQKVRQEGQERIRRAFELDYSALIKRGVDPSRLRSAAAMFLGSDPAAQGGGGDVTQPAQTQNSVTPAPGGISDEDLLNKYGG